MIFDSGFAKAAFECECKKVHYDVSVGEEMLVCSCGNVLAFREQENYFDYLWMTKRIVKSQIEYAINQDKRNLC